MSKPFESNSLAKHSAKTNYRNPLREKLQRGEFTQGLWITLSNPAVTEFAAELGLDWVCVDMEHGATSYADVANHVRAAKGTGVAVFVRVPTISVDAIARCLDLGVDGIVLPLVRSSDDILRAMDYMLYPPRGSRGLGGERAQKWGLGVEEYIASANDELILMPMIEHKDAVSAIDDILSIPGLDHFFIGPGDLSSSLGHIGQWDTAETAAAIAHVLSRAQVHGVTAGIYAIGPDDTRKRVEQGFRIIAIGSDLALMGKQIRSDQEVLGTKLANATNSGR
jgi:2-keto-3-deoxy-L-rhamnonate aldolase RhmA